MTAPASSITILEEPDLPMPFSLATIPTMHKLLFLCTANYYRSRFAEIFFNRLASQHQLDWVAESRGIAMEVAADNIGPISEHAINGLQSRGISVGEDLRFPIQLQEQDLKQADLILALDEQEHRPYMRQRFPDWVNKIEYWHVHDLHVSPADDALPVAEREIRAMVKTLLQHKTLADQEPRHDQRKGEDAERKARLPAVERNEAQS